MIKKILLLLLFTSSLAFAQKQDATRQIINLPQGYAQQSYAVDTGTAANAYAITLPNGTLVDGMAIGFRVAHANTGASTLSVNGGTALSIYKQGGTIALAPGDLQVGQQVIVSYSASQSAFQMQTGSGSPNLVAQTVAVGATVPLNNSFGVVQRNVFNVNSAPTAALFGQGGNGIDALTAAIAIPLQTSGNHTFQGDAFGSYVLNQDRWTNAVAGYFTCVATDIWSEVTGGCWGINPVVTTSPGFPSRAIAAELNVNASNVADIIYGLNITGGSTAAAANSFAVAVYPLGTNIPWEYGLYFADGAAANHFIGALSTNPSSPSQSLLFGSHGTDGTQHFGSLSVNPDGAIVASPQAGQAFVSTGNIATLGAYTNGNGTVIPSTATGYQGAGTKVALPVYGFNTLVSGTVTVSNAASCAPSATCVYKLANCAKNASTVIGTLSVGTVSAGTSFVINSLTAAAAVATADVSSVCWQIN